MFDPMWSSHANREPEVSSARVKWMSIHGCQVVPSSDRSQTAVIDLRSRAIVSVDRTRAVGVADDLDRAYRLTTYGDIDVVDEEMTAGEQLVDVGPEHRDLRFADHVTRSAPPSGDRREPFARGAGIGVGHGR